MRLITVTVKIHFEDDNGKPKSRNEHYLVDCRDFRDAIDIISEEFKGTGETWEIAKMVPSSLTAVLNYGGTRKVTNRTSAEVPERSLT